MLLLILIIWNILSIMKECGIKYIHPQLDYTYYLVQIADEDVNVIAPFINDQNSPVSQNERFSLIRWGSQVDLVLPLDERYDFDLVLEDEMHVNAGLDKLVKINFKMTHFNITPKAEEIFREKKVVKNPIKFKIQLNEEQKEAKQLILDNTITLISRSSRIR